MTDPTEPLGPPRTFLCPCGATQQSHVGSSNLHRDGRELCDRCAREWIKNRPRGRKSNRSTNPEEHHMAPKKHYEADGTTPKKAKRSAHAEAKPAAKRMRQKELPGLEKPRFPEIEKAAERYRDLRAERKALLDGENGAKERLIAAMRKHGQIAYRDDNADPPFAIFIVSDDKVKLENVKPKPKTEIERKLGPAVATEPRSDPSA